MSLYTATILSDSPQAYYRLNDASGSTASDSSPNARNATYNGGFKLGAVDALIAETTASVLLNGSTGYVAVPSSVTQGTTGTWECWFSLTTQVFATSPRPIANDNVSSSKKGVELGIDSNAAGIFANLGFTSSYVDIGYSTTGLIAGLWYHLALTYDGTNALLYLNGVQVASSSPGLTLATGSFSFNIGRNPSYSGDYFPGRLEEVAFYSTALSAARITAHYNAGMHTVITNQDAAISKYQVVKVYTPAGVFMDVIRDAPLISGYKENINAAADNLKLVLPRRVDAYDGLYQPGSLGTIALGNNVQVWIYGAGIPASGILRYNGVIDTITPQIDESGSESVEVLITPYSQLALGVGAVTNTLTFGTSGNSSTYIDTAQIFQSFFSGSYTNSSGVVTSTVDADTGNPYCYPFIMDPTSVAYTGQKTQFPFQNQTNLSALTNVLLLGPSNYFFRMNQNKTAYFGKYPTSPNYTLRLGQHITSIAFPNDNAPRKNVVVIAGNGVSGKYVGSSVSSIGKRVYFKSDNRITDANTAQALANGLGALYDQTIIRAQVKIPDYRGDSLFGLGYDIEQFKVGQTVKITDNRAPATSVTGQGSVWGSFVWGGGKWGGASTTQAIWGSFNWGGATWGASIGSIFNQVVPIMTIQYDFSSVTLELGFRQPTLSRAILDLAARFADATLVS